MNFSHLRYIVEVERCGSISKAAQALFMGQPNLSKAIKELETEFGVPIFRRSAKGVVPTEKGRELLIYAKAILAQAERMEAVSKSGQETARFSLVMPRAGYISHAFTMFLRQLDSAERLDIRLKETGALEAIELVAGCEYDLGMIRIPVERAAFYLGEIAERGLRARELWTFDYVVLMSQKSPLARSFQLEAGDLDDRIEVLSRDEVLPDTALSRRHILADERASRLDILTTVPDTYMWNSPLPREMLHRCGLVQKPCRRPGLAHRDILLSQSSYRFTDHDHLFLEILDEVRRGIIV